MDPPRAKWPWPLPDGMPERRQTVARLPAHVDLDDPRSEGGRLQGTVERRTPAELPPDGERTGTEDREDWHRFDADRIGAVQLACTTVERADGVELMQQRPCADGVVSPEFTFCVDPAPLQGSQFTGHSPAPQSGAAVDRPILVEADVERERRSQEFVSLGGRSKQRHGALSRCGIRSPRAVLFLVDLQRQSSGSRKARSPNRETWQDRRGNRAAQATCQS